MEHLLDEKLIVDSGLNVRLSKGIYLLDILKIEYFNDLSQSLAHIYIEHLISQTRYQFFNSIPSPLPEFSICLKDDWSLLIKSKMCYKTLLISPLSSFSQRSFPNCIRLILNSIKQTSYKIIGLITLFLSLKNPIIFLEVFKKLNFSELVFKTSSQVKNFVFISSKIPYKTLQFNILEAKDLLKTKPSPFQNFSAFLKPLLPIDTLQPKSKKLDMDLYEIHENSESMEYSPTQEVSSRKNIQQKKSPRAVSPILEEETHKRSISSIAESCIRLQVTPLHSPRQLSYSISEIKQIMQISAQPPKEPTKNTCSCSYCLIY